MLDPTQVVEINRRVSGEPGKREVVTVPMRAFIKPRRPYRYSEQYELRSESSSGMGNLLVIWNHKQDTYTLQACQFPLAKKLRSDRDRTKVFVKLQKAITEQLQDRGEMLLLWEVTKVAGECRVAIRHIPTYAQILSWTPMAILPPLQIVYEGHREEMSRFFGEAFRPSVSENTDYQFNKLSVPLLKQQNKNKKHLKKLLKVKRKLWMK